MKQVIIIILFPLNLLSQNLSLSPHFSYYKTSLYNKEDTKANNKILYMTPTYTLNYGLDIGWYFNRESGGLSAINIGINYAPIVQKYEGIYFGYSPNSKAKATTKLNYVQIPLNFEFAISAPKRIQPVVQVGLDFNYLLSYSDIYHADWMPSGGSYTNHDLSIKDGKYIQDMGNGQLHGEANLSDWYYKRIVWSAHLGAGAEVLLNNRMEAGILLNGQYSLSDPENKKSITYTPTGFPVTAPFSKNPYEAYYAKLSPRGTMPKRGASHLFSLGIQLSFNYKLFDKN